MNILTLSQVHKSFGTQQVLKGLDLTVKKNSIHGFLGQNGAGKTTTMRLILGIDTLDSGSIHIYDEVVCPGSTSKYSLGYLPDVPEFYPYMRPLEYLKLCGEICGMDQTAIRSRSEELLELTGLSDCHKKIGGFSRGMKQRLGIAQALFQSPDLLICDEPTSALDPVGRKEILDILASIGKTTTVLFSTHILSDVERICDSVSVLHQGQIVLDGTLDSLRQNTRAERYLVHSRSEDLAALTDSFKGQGFLVEPTEGNALLVTPVETGSSRAQFYNVFSQSGIYPESAKVVERTLEDLYLEVVQ